MYWSVWGTLLDSLYLRIQLTFVDGCRRHVVVLELLHLFVRSEQRVTTGRRTEGWTPYMHVHALRLRADRNGRRSSDVLDAPGARGSRGAL